MKNHTLSFGHAETELETSDSYDSASNSDESMDRRRRRKRKTRRRRQRTKRKDNEKAVNETLREQSNTQSVNEVYATSTDDELEVMEINRDR